MRRPGCYVELVRFGEPIGGRWCDDCMLSTAVEVRFVTLVPRPDGDTAVSKTYSAFVCLSCGREWGG